MNVNVPKAQLRTNTKLALVDCDIHPRLRKPQELAVLQAVAAWREREARERDVPRGRVLKDDAIYEIAQQQPRDAAALARLRTTPKTACCAASGERIPPGKQPSLLDLDPRVLHHLRPFRRLAVDEAAKLLGRVTGHRQPLIGQLLLD